MTEKAKLPGVEAKRPSIEERLDELLSPIELQYNGWLSDDGRATSALYHLLGKLFEADAVVKDDIDLLFDLRKKAKKHPDVKGSRAYKAEKKTALDLLLTVYLGTKRWKGRKSQWRSAILAAPADIERTEGAFVKWIEQPGVGMTGARRKYRKDHAKPRTKKRLSDLLEAIPAPSASAPLIKVKLPQGLTLPEGYAVGLLKKVPGSEADEGEASFQLVRFIADDEPVTRVVDYAAHHEGEFSGSILDEAAEKLPSLRRRRDRGKRVREAAKDWTFDEEGEAEIAGKLDFTAQDLVDASEEELPNEEARPHSPRPELEKA